MNKVVGSTNILAFIQTRFGIRLTLSDELCVFYMSDARNFKFETPAIFFFLSKRFLTHLSFQRKLKTKEEQREKNTEMESSLSTLKTPWFNSSLSSSSNSSSIQVQLKFKFKKFQSPKVKLKNLVQRLTP